MFVSFREVATILIDKWKVAGNVGCETLSRVSLTAIKPVQIVAVVA
jgi:hypothetical protein